MKNVVWKKFKLADIFERKTPPSTDSTAKVLNIYDEPFENSVALITRAETNNGIRGYIEKGNYPTLKKGITYNDQFSFFLFHNYEFTTIKDHLSVITATNEKLQEIIKKNDYISVFITTILNHIFSKEIFSFNFTGADYRYNREIFLLPCIEVKTIEEAIWEENGKYYTLAENYIKNLMEQAKELREQKTIRLYEAERAKYEAERAKYEAEYLKEKKCVVWKRFKLDELFEFDSGNQLDANKKALNLSDEKDEEHPIALITQSEKNNGVSGYLDITDEIKTKKMNNFMTYSMHFGLCFFHEYDFVLMDTHGSVFRLIPKSDNFDIILNQKPIIDYYLSKIITKVCRNGIYNYSWLPNSGRVGREVILLPCIEVKTIEEAIWEENGKYYTLAENYISYLYLSGKVNQNQKLIDNYTYQY